MCAMGPNGCNRESLEQVVTATGGNLTLQMSTRPILQWPGLMETCENGLTLEELPDGSETLTCNLVGLSRDHEVRVAIPISGMSPPVVVLYR